MSTSYEKQLDRQQAIDKVTCLLREKGVPREIEGENKCERLATEIVDLLLEST